jgi:integrase
MAKRKLMPPPGARQTSSGRWTVTIRDNECERRSHSKILPSLPKTFATVEEAWEGYNAVQAYLKLQVDHEQTVQGFADRWLDEDDPRWGIAAKPQRGPETRVVYASRVRDFAAMYATRPMASITDADVLAYQRSSHYAASQMRVISTFLRDAASDKLRVGDPAAQITKEAVDALAWRRTMHKPKAPSLAQVEAALAHMRRHLDVYPRGLYGWFLSGVRTGMRGAELDGMEFEHVEGDRYLVRWQLHGRFNERRLPKWVRDPSKCRKVFLPEDVIAEIRYQRRERMALDWQEPWIWLNTEGGPWRHDARDKWWDKQVGGTSLRQICGGVPIYNATRHHWASHALNVVGLAPYQAALLFGHRDGGKTLIERYVDPDADAAVDAVAQMRALHASNVQELRP